VSNPQKLMLRLDNEQHHRLDGYIRSFGGQMNTIFNKVPADILQQGMQDGWKSVMKSGQRFLGGSRHVKESALKKGVFEVQKVIGYEESELGKRYLVVWKGFPGEDSWQQVSNFMPPAGSAALCEFLMMRNERLM
jgi:hypothetical protein